MRYPTAPDIQQQASNAQTTQRDTPGEIIWAVHEGDDCEWIFSDTGKVVGYDRAMQIMDCHADKCECEKCSETDNNNDAPQWFEEKWGV